MFTSASKKRLALTLALTAAVGGALIGTPSVKADPAQYGAFVGAGSDTIQDVFNAFTGTTNGTQYTPLVSGTATGNKQVISFDASVPSGLSDTCVTTKLGGPTFTRPNGSTGGRKALYASSGLSSVGWTGVAIGALPTCASAVDISGQVDFARSSSGPANGDLGTDLTYLPFGRDGVSFAYYRASGGAAVTSLTRAQLTTIFTSATQPVLIGGVNIYACGIQTSSGTFSFWNTVTTASTSQENTATTACNGFGGLGRAQENDASALKARGDAAPAGSQVIIGFSAASFVASANLVAPGAPPAGVGIGSISDNGSGVNLGSPVSGTAPNLAPSTSFFGDSIFGRNVYVVLPTSIATGPGNAAIKALFVGTTAAICNQTPTLNKFGFLSVGTGCGSTTLKGSWITGAS